MSAEKLEPVLMSILQKNPSGLSEYDFLSAVWASDCDAIPVVDDHDELKLFQAHFLLFHALYRLRDKLWHERQGHLEISPLEIILRPYRANDAGLAQADLLREYYIDIGNLKQTSADDVGEMLNRFWERFYADSERHGALAVLGLKEPVDFQIIKRRYRSLAMQHHPDRGGDDDKTREINAAMEILERLYR